jgi:hypothetical protein
MSFRKPWQKRFLGRQATSNKRMKFAWFPRKMRDGSWLWLRRYEVKTTKIKVH